ncbi:MAG: ABC transporter permease [Candidatus Aminicenantales bacterium]
MKKFFNLLIKEIRELITRQLIFSLIVMLGLFYFIGQLAKKEVIKAVQPQKISILDLDRSASSQELIRNLRSERFEIELMEANTKESAIDAAKEGNTNLLLVIPRGFGESVSEFPARELETYSFIRSFSLSGMKNSAVPRRVVSAINGYYSNALLQEKLPEADPDYLKNPIKSKDFVIVKSRMAEASAEQITGLVYSQSVFIPVILMMIIIYSSQMVISAIALEKQNKTLETLLTVPISRTSIITAKMLSSGLVGLLSAAIYMIGFRYFMRGFSGDIPSPSQMTGIVQKLGLSFTTNGYLILGASLFFAILCALAMAMILGVLAEDFRSAQGLIMPMIFLVMIPYFLSLFSDVNSLSLPLKIFILAIPFSHPFLTTQNIFLENYSFVLYGILYMFLVFVVLVLIAAHIFSTDKILTMKLKWGKKKRMAL